MNGLGAEAARAALPLANARNRGGRRDARKGERGLLIGGCRGILVPSTRCRVLLTITTTTPTATDLGYLLHKHPQRVQAFDLAFGKAHVFYPEATEVRCTAALLLDVDPVALVRKRRGPAGAQASMDQYVNDRPYVASSFMSVAIARVFGTALAGNCAHRPELVDTVLDLELCLAAAPVRRGGEGLVKDLFEPLGYEVATQRTPLDERFPAWGEGPYHQVTLRTRQPLRDVLSHLYVLVPVLDNDKHYWVGRDELEKLLRHGERWLAAHPHRERITQRYLRHVSRLTRQALARLTDGEEPDPEAAVEQHDREEEQVERPLSLNEQRHAAVIAALKAGGTRRVLDIGCAQGVLLRRLLADGGFDELIGLDVSLRSLERAELRLRLDRLPERQRESVRLLHGSLMYRDERLRGYDAALLIEVIEHMDPPRLAALERNVFAFAQPAMVVVTTPNVEYNVRFESLPAGSFRHRDHRFEWTRAEFEAWAGGVADRFGYRVRFLPIGEVDAEVGAPTQMAIFDAAP